MTSMVGAAKHQRVRLIAATFSALVVLALVLTTHSALIRDFHLRGDDFPLVLNSSSEYISASDALLWFTSGYSHYFDNYPGWETSTAFVRPVQNAFIWGLSWLAPLVGDRVYLLGNHLLVAILAGLVTYLFSLRAHGSPWTAAILGSAVALSPAFQMPLWWPSFGTNLLAAVFSVASLIVLLDSSGEPSRKRVVFAAALQCLAVSGHETAIVMPVVAALLLAAEGRLPTLRTAWPLLAPFALFGAFRLLLTGSGAVYVTRGGFASVAEQFRFFAVQSFYPWDAYRFAGERARDGLSTLTALAFGVGALANVALGAIMLRRKRSSRGGRGGVLTTLAFCAAVLPALLNPTEPRFFGLGLIMAVLVTLGVSKGWLRTTALSLVALAGLLTFSVMTIPAARHNVESVQFTTVQLEDMRKRIGSTAPDTVILVNDRVGLEGASAMVLWAAHPATPLVKIVNSVTGPAEPSAGITIESDERSVYFTVRPGTSQRAEFLPAAVNFSIPTRHFSYRALDERAPHGSFKAVGTLERGVTLVIGIDPATDTVLVTPPIRR